MMSFVQLIVTLQLVTGFPPLRAEPTSCDCTQYLGDFVPQLSLSSDLDAIGLELLDPAGRSQELQHRREMSRRARLAQARGVPPECEEQFFAHLSRLEGQRLSTTVSGQLPLSHRNPSKGLVQNTARPEVLLILAEQVFASAVPRSCAKSPCPPGGFEKDFQQFLQHWSGLSAEKKLQKLNRTGSTPAADRISSFSQAMDLQPESRKASLSDIKLVDAYFSLMKASGDAEYFRTAETLAQTLNESEKVALVAMMGGKMLSGYDDVRKSDLLDGKSISFSKMRANTQRNFLGRTETLSEADRNSETQSLGVCRDIAVSQAILSKKLGLKKPVIIGYSMQSSLHATVAIEAKDDQGQTIYLVNYGAVATRKGTDGSRLLVQDQDPGMRDHSLVYRVFDAEGNPLGQLSSGRGKFLMEAAGFDSRSFDPLASVQNDLITGGTYFGKQSQTAVRMVAGRDESGDLYLGAASTHVWGKTKDSKPQDRFSSGGKVGGFIGTTLPTQHVPNPVFEPQRTDLATVLVQQTWFTPTLGAKKDQPGLSVHGEAGVDLMAGVHAEYGTEDIHFRLEDPSGRTVGGGSINQSGNTGVGGDGTLQGRIKGTVQYQSSDSDTRVRVSPEVRVHAGPQNVQNSALDFTYTRPSFGSFSLSAEIDHRFWRDWRAHARSLVVVDPMGSRGLAAVGVRNSDLAVESSISGRISSSSDAPRLIQDNSLNRLRFNSRYRLGNSVDLGTQLQLDEQTAPQAGIYLEGSF